MSKRRGKPAGSKSLKKNKRPVILSPLTEAELRKLTPRSFREIASDIERHWDDIDHRIVPYLVAMKYLKDYRDSYMGMTAEHVIEKVYYYIRDWTYERGRVIRAELKIIRRQLRNQDN